MPCKQVNSSQVIENIADVLRSLAVLNFACITHPLSVTASDAGFSLTVCNLLCLSVTFLSVFHLKSIWSAS